MPESRFKILVEIPARGGSKGVPGKALRMLGGLPLIAYTIKDALELAGAAKVLVNTDDENIREAALEHGAEVPFLRPAGLASDTARLEDAHLYALEWYKENEGFVPDIEIVMSPTHPFRRPGMLNNAVRLGLENRNIFNIGTISPVFGDMSNFWVKKAGGEGDKGGEIEGFSIPDMDGKAGTALYQSSFSFVIVFSYRKNSHEKRFPVILNEIEAIDIDEMEDLEIARTIIEKGLYPFA